MLIGNDFKKVITKAEKLQIEGLMTLAHNAVKQLKACDEAMAEIINYEDADLLLDGYYDDNYNVTKILKTMGIKVK